MKKALYFIPLVLLIFSACEVEFSPNAEWKNIPVVYCLLDQDDDTTFVRVQRAFLSEDNIYSYGSVTDSINYPVGSIEVSLLTYNNGVIRDSFAFNSMLRDHDSGNFAYQAQPIYYCRTKGKLRESDAYVLSIRNTADNSILVRSKPINLIRKTESTLITKPTVNYIGGGGFYFNDAAGNSSNYCHIQWKSLENARRYQPMVRFYYEENDSTRYIDLLCPSTTSHANEIYYSRDQFLSDIKVKLQDDTCRKHYLGRVDLYLTACSEELNAYLFMAHQATILDQATQVYSNIEGGVGIFAARRTHLYKSLPADTSLRPGRGLLYFLDSLGVGIY